MKILLICSAGTSTSLVVQKMQQVAKKEGKDYTIVALSQAEAQREGKNYDVLLLGPQLKFQIGLFKGLYPNKPVDSIPPMVYGRLDGEGVIKLAEDIYNNYNK